MPYKNRDSQKEYDRQRYAANKEVILANKDKDHQRDYDKERYSKNREKCCLNSKKYAAKNKESIKKRQEAYKTSISGRYATAKRTAKARKMEFNLTIEEHAEIIKSGVCHYCDKPLCRTGSGLDRKNNERFYDKTNSVPCCKRCNETFMSNYTYQAKLMLARVIKEIDLMTDKEKKP